MTKGDILAFLKKHKQMLSDNYQVKHIGLFGSYATGTNTDKSDIDIVVDMPSSFDLYYDLKEYLESAFERSVDLGLKKSIRGMVREKIESETIYV